jgi:hypothetical protein
MFATIFSHAKCIAAGQKGRKTWGSDGGLSLDFGI